MTSWLETPEGQKRRIARLKINDKLTINKRVVVRLDDFVFAVSGVEIRSGHSGGSEQINYLRLVEQVYHIAVADMLPVATKLCKQCQAPMPIGIRKDALYCCHNCAAVAHQTHYEQRKGRKGLRKD